MGIPFVVRAIQPVLEKLDGSYEEAARVMGAKPFTVFRRVILPELLPAMLSGAGLAFGRCLGEYGSVGFYCRKQALLYRDHAADHHVKASGV